VQNVVGIDGEVSIMCKFLYYANLARNRLFTPLLGGFGDLPDK